MGVSHRTPPTFTITTTTSSFCCFCLWLTLFFDSYNPEIIETLENYVSFQSKGDCYDFEANLALLKLYQFRPSCVNQEVAGQILLKSLTQLPSTDFIMLKCVLAQSLVNGNFRC